ncbi:MAG: single-stranded DNA-binding protein [Sediminibacterium magnilacihabitans]|jgi:single-strand DNA-binding protein|nr:single-stranded DNA-binding protein [Sediminibacterium magnilacihabitans]PQV59482.1 single-strand DNA-binding protein [Sediminibacterium magnilacihabitans]
MKTQNTVQLIGYLGLDPILRTAINGSKLARFRVATDYFRRHKDGSVTKKVTWHNVLAWDWLAEKIPGNFIKGSHVLIKGEIRHRKFKNKSGKLQSITEVRASELLNLDR